MKVQQKLDKVLEIVRESVQEEVGALMGVNFKLSEFFNQIISKEDYFADVAGKKIAAKMDITGEIEGYGCLLIDLKDGIRLGGTLIMLPHAELDEVVKNESYTEETEDSYGEIANIIAGSYTKVFEENYPKNCRFVRKEQAVVTPLKVDIESDEPFLDQWYYLVRSEMSMDGLEMGELDFLIPAVPFGLEVPAKEEKNGKEPDEIESVVETDSEDIGDKSEDVDDALDDMQSVEIAGASAEDEQEVSVEQTEEGESSKQLPPVEAEKHKKKINKLLEQCRKTISQEVSALLGVDLKLTGPDNRFVNKEQFFFEETSGKQVLAHMEVTDENEGKSYLFVSLKDAIRIGSILIMLPPSELENAVGEEDFSADAEDAYGEIANIISGAYTSVFQDQYTESIRFIKKELETVSPMKVDIDTDEVIPNQPYYMNRWQLEIDGQPFGKINMLFPADLLKLAELTKSDEKDVSSTEQGTSTDSDSIEAAVAQEGASLTGAAAGGGQSEGEHEVLIIENNHVEANIIQGELLKYGIASKCISYNDSIKDSVTDRLKLIIIVMKEVDEQSYGVTIKANTLTTVPIVAAGPAWTRSKVIKAVKYGVRDILLTPSSSDDIKEKVDNNIMKMAA